MKRKPLLLILGICIISILGLCVLVPDLVVWVWHQYWQATVAKEKLYAVHSAYPGAVVVDNVASLSQWSAGNNVTLNDVTTFQTPDSWAIVQEWYAKHPDGGVCTYDIKLDSDHCRLELVENTAGKTLYQVRYSVTFECGDNLTCIDTPTP